MILFLTGEDTYRLQKRLEFLRQGFIAKYDKSGLSVETLDGSDLKVEDFQRAVMSQGLLATKRFVAVKDIFGANNALCEEVAELLENVPEDTVLVFTAEKIPAKEKVLSKKLKAVDKVEKFDPLKGFQLHQFVQQEIKNLGGTIDKDAENYLVQAVGDDLWRMSQEIAKLVNYDKRVTLKITEEFVPSAVDDNIFNFTDAIANKNAALALKLLHDQIKSGANEFYLLTMIARQVKILLQVKETNGEGLDLHPFVIKKAAQQVGKFSAEDLKKLYNKLVDIDLKIKTSQAEPGTLLDLFVMEACE
ncbi:DNA polymerase III subunit delta [Patescibacteria group bacterium]|nr:DNA polymerase III subunit delta [Patescibacteria group bacterium]MBU1673802.1 DNA polymerase III subunit delta [Patescibacteria group bacterium]MBU1963829.1 DNA polymerase III subunit delta [Patescibacteria group bacterium]